MNDIAVKVAELPNEHHSVETWGVDFSPDGKLIAIGADDESIYVWDWRAKRKEVTLIQPQGANGALATTPFAFSPDGTLLASCVGRGAGEIVARIWHVSDWTVAKDIIDTGSGGCIALAFAPDNGSLLLALHRQLNSQNSAVVYGIGTWKVLWGVQFENFEPDSMAMSPDGKLAAFAGTFYYVPVGVTDVAERIRQARNGPRIEIVDFTEQKIIKSVDSVALGTLAWNPSGTHLAAAGRQNLDMLDVKSGAWLTQDFIDKSAHLNVRYTPDGRYFLESDYNGQGTGLGLAIWDGERKALVQTISGNINSMAVSRDSKLFAVGTRGGTAIWRIK